MIPAAQPYSASFRQDDKKFPVDHVPIVAWDDEGHGLIMAERKSKLVRAKDEPGFQGIYPDAVATVAVTPGAGWLIEYRDAEDVVTTSPVIGWAVQADGNGFALDVAEDGNCVCAGLKKGFRRVYHPDYDCG